MCDNVYVISYTNGKLKLMNDPYEIHYQRNGKDKVKIVYFENHNGKTGHCVPKKYSKSGKKKAIEIICKD